MKTVIVAEKPSVARDIARVVGARTAGEGCLEGDSYVVTWALGHLVTLMEPDEIDARYKKWAMQDLPILPQEIPLKVLPKTKKQFAVVKRLLNAPTTGRVICATDAAREGELIFRYIYRMAGCKKPVWRLWISSMTDEAIREGMANLRPAGEYDALYESARCRAVADWLVGMNASRAFTLRYGALLPMGRVQTPTLALLVRRDREIAAFAPEDYWEVRADFGDFQALYYDPEKKQSRAPTREMAEKIKRETAGREGVVVHSRREEKRVPPPRLFDLTSLQREANARFGFSAEKTLKIAQALYERHKVLTYPRTDSRALPAQMRAQVRATLEGLGEPWSALVRDARMRLDAAPKRVYDDAKVSDHHAIIPTRRRPGNLSEQEVKIYDLVARSLIAAHYPDYVYEAAALRVQAGQYEFRSTGAVAREAGWKAVLSQADGRGEQALPDVREGEKRLARKVSIAKKQTRPPAPLTDNTLLAQMENAGSDLEDEELRERMKGSGLGTPATRAAIIERLIKTGLAARKGKAIVSTQKGRNLIQVAPEQIASAATTGKWERALNAMAANRDAAQRQQKAERFLQGICRFSAYLVEAAKAAPAQVQFEREAPRRKSAAAAQKRARPQR